MKTKKGEGSMDAILAMIILIFLGVAFITVIGSTTKTQTALLSSNEQSNLQNCYTSLGQVNESNSACNITVENWYPAKDWRLSASECYLSDVNVKNNTGTALTLGTDYKVYSNIGVIQFLNTTTTENSSTTLSNNLVNTSYSYCSSSYLTNSRDRGLANLWILFAILALLGAVIGIVLKIWRDNQ